MKILLYTKYPISTCIWSVVVVYKISYLNGSNEYEKNPSLSIWFHFKIALLTISLSVSSFWAVAWYDRTSNATVCFAINRQAFSYIWQLWIPRPVKIEKAWKIGTERYSSQYQTLVINLYNNTIKNTEEMLNRVTTTKALSSKEIGWGKSKKYTGPSESGKSHRLLLSGATHFYQINYLDDICIVLVEWYTVQFVD